MRTIRHIGLHWFVAFMCWAEIQTAWAYNLTAKAADILEADHRHYA